MSQGTGTKLALEVPQEISQKAVTEDEIRVRAYEIFVARAGAPGDDVQDWLAAEAELLSEGR